MVSLFRVISVSRVICSKKRWVFPEIVALKLALNYRKWCKHLISVKDYREIEPSEFQSGTFKISSICTSISVSEVAYCRYMFLNAKRANSGGNNPFPRPKRDKRLVTWNLDFFSKSDFIDAVAKIIFRSPLLRWSICHLVVHFVCYEWREDN